VGVSEKIHFTRNERVSYVDSDFDELRTTGNVWWVDSAHRNAADQTGNGYSPDYPFATVAYAVGVATADNGDLILCAPGHTESLVSAGAIAMARAGVTVRGLGTGRQRARFTFTTSTAATWTVTAARCRLENVVLVNGIDAQVNMLSVSAADFALAGCEVVLGDGTTQAVNGVLTSAAADRLAVEGNDFHGGSTAGTDSAVSLVGGADIVIRNNDFVGAFHATGGVVKNATTDSTNLRITGNRFANSTAANTKAVVLTAPTTGLIADNTFQILSGSRPVTAAGAAQVGNTYTSALASDPGGDVAGLGRKVTRAAADIFDGTQKALFTVATGKVQVTAFYLEVSGAAVDATPSNLKVRSNPTVGTDADLSANMDVNADEVGSIYSITGNPTDATTGGSGGGAQGMHRPFVIDVGTLDIVTSADAGTGGALVAATVWYLPLEDGATVAAT
jgi:hypothetical protein